MEINNLYVQAAKNSLKLSLREKISHFKVLSAVLLAAYFESKHLWQYGLWNFQMGDKKLERLLPNNQHTRRKILNFEFWINGELSKSAKI